MNSLLFSARFLLQFRAVGGRSTHLVGGRSWRKVSCTSETAANQSHPPPPERSHTGWGLNPPQMCSLPLKRKEKNQTLKKKKMLSYSKLKVKTYEPSCHHFALQILTAAKTKQPQWRVLWSHTDHSFYASDRSNDPSTVNTSPHPSFAKLPHPSILHRSWAVWLYKESQKKIYRNNFN